MRGKFFLLGAALSVLHPAQAAAQSKQTDAATDQLEKNTLDESVLEEIVVTAQKREQKVQDTPLSISAFTGETLAKSGISNAAAVAAQVPNLTVGFSGNSGQQPIVSLRGVVLNDFNTNNESPVAFYTDEVYVSTLIATNFGLYDLERVEVLRGPQGTLYGRNATGGTINFYSKKPKSDRFSADGLLSYSSFNTKRAELAVNIPLGGEWAIRLAGLHNNDDGTFENLTNRTQHSKANEWSYRASLAGTIADRFDVYAKFQGSNYRNKALGYKHFGLNDSTTGARCANVQILANQCVDALGYGSASVGFRQYESDTNAVAEGDFYSGQLRMDWDIGGVILTSITAYDDVSSLTEDNTDASPLRLISIAQGVTSKTRQQEIRASGKTDRLDYVAGVYLYSQRLKQNNFADVFGELRAATETVDPIAYPRGFDPLGLAIGVPVFQSRGINQQQTNSLAVFGQATLEISDAFSITGGLRWTKDRRSLAGRVFFDEGSFQLPVFDFDSRINESRVTWRGVAEWRPAKGVLTYLSISNGFKSGGANGGFVFEPTEVQPFRREALTAYELGIKGEVWNNRLRYNIAGFYYDYRDIQIFTIQTTGGLARNLLVNGGNAANYGLEGDFEARLAKGLTARAGLGLISANYTSGQFDTKRISFTPKLKFNAGLDYSVELKKIGFMNARVDATYQSKVYFDPSNSELLSQNGYWLTNARIGWSTGDDRFSVDLFAKNILSKQYFAQKVELTPYGLIEATAGEPRYFGIEGRFGF